MLRLGCHLSVGPLELDFVHEVRIESTWQKLTDTCVLQLPRRALVLGGRDLPSVVKVGDRVVVRYGYDGVLRTEFSGYVVGIKTGPPAEIQCEDEMYLLKRKTLTHHFSAVSLQGLLEYVRDQNGLRFPIQVLGATSLGKFTINQATGAQVLDCLRKDYGIRCFFRAGTLIAGDPYQVAGGGEAPRHRALFRRNIVQHDLQYVRAEDIRIKVRAISHIEGKRKGSRKRISKEFGDLVDGELRTLNFVGVSEADLITRAKAELARLRFDGYRGSVTLFGVPFVEHGDIVEVLDPDYPERDGAFSVEKVEKIFGVGGSRRVVKLGPKA